MILKQSKKTKHPTLGNESWLAKLQTIFLTFVTWKLAQQPGARDSFSNMVSMDNLAALRAPEILILM